MESTILFIGEKHFAGTAAGSVIFCLRKKTSYRQNLRNATNLLSTFESSPTCQIFKNKIKLFARPNFSPLKRHVGELSKVDKRLVTLRRFCR